MKPSILITLIALASFALGLLVATHLTQIEVETANYWGDIKKLHAMTVSAEQATVLATNRWKDFRTGRYEFSASALGLGIREKR